MKHRSSVWSCIQRLIDWASRCNQILPEATVVQRVHGFGLSKGYYAERSRRGLQDRFGWSDGFRPHHFRWLPSLDNTIALVASLTSNRSTVEGYVHQVKLCYRASDPIYVESQARYGAASSTYANSSQLWGLNILNRRRSGFDGPCFTVPINDESFYYLCCRKPLSSHAQSPLSANHANEYREIARGEGKAGGP